MHRQQQPDTKLPNTAPAVFLCGRGHDLTPGARCPVCLADAAAEAEAIARP